FYEVVDGKARMLRGGVLRVVEVTRVEARMRVPAKETLKARTPVLLAQPGACASVVDEKDTTVIDKNSIRESVPLAERQVCSNVCVEEDTPIVQIAVAKKRLCAPCVLPEILSDTVRGITLVVVEEKIERAVVMHDVAGVVEEVMVDVVAETDDFTVGITDAMGTPLQGVVAASDGVTGKPPFWKKSRLRRYCKG
ncbi:MAG: hypothetical protein J7621_27645, partial [Niastella sp.]|nr:hypothetical protein [Niastella sp.]